MFSQTYPLAPTVVGSKVREWVETAAAGRAGTLVAILRLGSHMIEHRRAERFRLVDPAVGSLRMVQDVEIAQLRSHQAIVIAPGPLPRGERLLLEIPVARDAHPCTVLVRVVNNRVVMDDGSLRRRVRLQVIERAPRDRGLEGVRIPRGQSVMGALIRRGPGARRGDQYHGLYLREPVHRHRRIRWFRSDANLDSRSLGSRASQAHVTVIQLCVAIPDGCGVPDVGPQVARLVSRAGDDHECWLPCCH